MKLKRSKAKAIELLDSVRNGLHEFRSVANGYFFQFDLILTHQPRSWEWNIPLWKTKLVESHHGHDAAMDRPEYNKKIKSESTTSSTRVLQDAELGLCFYMDIQNAQYQTIKILNLQTRLIFKCCAN